MGIKDLCFIPISAAVSPAPWNTANNKFFSSEANIADNFSIDALTRAADPEKEPTANKGVYDLTLKFVDGLTKDELTALESAETAYALTTKDAWGNEIISQ